MRFRNFPHNVKRGLNVCPSEALDDLIRCGFHPGRVRLPLTRIKRQMGGRFDPIMLFNIKAQHNWRFFRSHHDLGRVPSRGDF
jgi:hypothetical protein